jgi:hypothetical protein
VLPGLAVPPLGLAVPYCVTDFAKTYSIQPEKSPMENFQQFVESLPRPSNEEVNSIQTTTRDQSSNNQWFRLRAGRITASKVYRVVTRVKTLEGTSNRSKDPESLVKDIAHVNRFNTGQNDARSYGINMEAAAIAHYKDQNCHPGVKFENCGFHISQTHPYIGASPDLLVSCNCCGDGLVEVKCPYSKRDVDIQLEPPDYVVHGKTRPYELKTNHAYYAQIQTQLAVTGRTYCDFVMYSPLGSIIIEQVPFDLLYWENILTSANKFYIHYIVPELIGMKAIPITACPTDKLTKAKCKRKRVSTATDYVCPVCDARCLETPSRFLQQSIQCDACQLWLHVGCVGIKTKTHLEKVGGAAWYCTTCTSVDNVNED